MSKLQRGVISITSWALLGLSTVVVIEGAVVKHQHTTIQTERREAAEYKGGVEALGRAAAIATAKTNLANLRNKERTDEETKRVAARDATDARRLRDDIASRGVLPGPGPSAVRPDLACFDRAELDGALREFANEAADVAAEGTAAQSALNLAKSWVLSRPPK